jgi:hypothetical protein
MYVKRVVSVKFYSGLIAESEVSCYEDYLTLKGRLKSWWGKWIDLDHKTVVRKSDIQSIVYIRTEYENLLTD